MPASRRPSVPALAVLLAVLLAAPAALGVPPRSEAAAPSAGPWSWSEAVAAWLGGLGELLRLDAAATDDAGLDDAVPQLDGSGGPDGGDALIQPLDSSRKVGPTWDPNGG